MNLSSLNIRVFPTTTRTEIDPQARLMTEYNLTSLINRLVDKDAFVITSNLGDHTFCFNIQGYIFSVASWNSSATSGIEVILNEVISDETFSAFKIGDIISANIQVKRDIGTLPNNSSPSELKTWSQLQGTDGSNKYNGVAFTYNDHLNSDDDAYSYSLDLFKCISIEGELPTTLTDDSFTEDQFVSELGKYYKWKNNPNIIFTICPDSKIKFETNTEGTNRSVRIDDGVL